MALDIAHKQMVSITDFRWQESRISRQPQTSQSLEKSLSLRVLPAIVCLWHGRVAVPCGLGIVTTQNPLLSQQNSYRGCESRFKGE
jgi:hypothetical protein